MSKILTLKRALRDGIVKEGDYLDYKPLHGECVLTEAETGWVREQEFETETFGWRLKKWKGHLLLVADGATKRLRLRGKIGYEHGIKAMNKMCGKLYTHPQIAKKAIAITDKIRNNGIYKIHDSYWLGSSYVVTSEGYTCFRVCYVYDGYENGIYLYNSYGDTCYDSNGVRPVVFLKSNIQIIIETEGGTKTNPWKFCL